MQPRVDAVALWARALAIGSVAFLLGVVGHVMADGLLPGPAFLVALGAFSVLVTVPMLNRPASGVRLAAILVAGQSVIHLALTLTAGHRGEPSPFSAAPRAVPRGVAQLPTVDGRRVGSLLDAYQATRAGQSAQPTLPIHHLVADVQAHAQMMVVHLAAAALVGLWLAVGERALWTLVALLGRRLVALVHRAQPVTVAAPSCRSYLADRAPLGPCSVWLVRSLPRRGPPLLLV